MKVITSKTDLVDALGIVNRAVSSRSSIQVLAGVLLEASPDGITLTATDMEISIRTPLQGKVETAGSAVLPARILTDIARSLAGGEVVLDKLPTAAQMELRSGESEFVLRVLPGEDFPALPVFPVEEGFTVEKQGFLTTVDRVATSASKDETRPVLTGVLMHVAKKSVKMVATDSYRLSVKETPIEATVKDALQVIVPGRCLLELSRIGASLAAEVITVVPTENQILFEVGDVLLISRLIDGQFPDYRQLIPESFESRAVAQKDELVEALNRVRLLAQKSAPVKLLFGEGNLTMSAQSQDVGAAKESLLVQYEGESLEIGFNPEFLLAGAMSVPDEEVDMRFISPLRPGLLRGKDEDFLYLIMPIRLND